MKLARKLTVALMIGILAVLVLDAALQIRRDEAIFAEDTATDEHVMARSLRAAVETVWRLDGEVQAKRLLEGANQSEQQVRIRLLPLDPASAASGPAVLSPRELDGLRAGREISVIRGEGADERRFTYAPITVAGAHPATVELSESLKPQRAYIRTSQIQILVATLVLVLLCGLVATALGFWIVGRPMHELSERARQVGAGDLSSRLELSQRDEIGELATELNLMCDRLEEANRRVSSEIQARMRAVEQLRHADRLKTVGQLASGVAHELGTPLNVVSGRARLIEVGDLPFEEIGSNASIIVEQAQRMTTIIRQLLDFSRRRGPNLAPTDLARIALDTVAMLSPLAAKRNVDVRFQTAEESGPVRVDRNQIQQALANVVLNGIQASPPGREVRVGLALVETRPPTDLEGSARPYYCVTVEDQGAGIAEEHIGHIFEPFFTTKDVGQGTGLGLSVAYGIVTEHGGWIDVSSDGASGSRFQLFLTPAEIAHEAAGELASEVQS